MPAVVALSGNLAHQYSLLSVQATGLVWATAVLWAGMGCFINGLSCGRVHCRIDGILLPTLSLLGFLNVLSIVSFSWNFFWLAFLAILAASFVPELVWKKYS